MKRFKVPVPLLIGLVVMGAALILQGGAKRITDYEGTVTATLRNIDSSATTTGISKILITDEARNSMYDFITTSFVIDSFQAAAAGTPGGLGVKDTGKIILYAGKDWFTFELGRDSCNSLPCTCDIRYPIDSDTSAAGTWLHNYDKDKGLYLDHIWFDYYVADCTGTADTISSDIHYWIRLVERDVD